LPPDPSPNLTTRVIWEDPLSLVVAPEHPLSHKRNIKLQDLARHAAILPAGNTYTRQIAEQAFRKLGLEIDIALSTNYMETIKMLVSVGIGWSILPQTMLDKHVRKLAVKELALQRSLGIVYHRERTLSNAAIALSKLLGHA
jgi:DNA-binding transcriptional LysR family regulator